ncbi:MAG: hypothetical protein AAF702_00980 [Chloroflexota bacterium]
MSQTPLEIGHSTSLGAGSEGNHTAQTIAEIDHEGQSIWGIVLASGKGLMPDGTPSSQFAVSQIYNGLFQHAESLEVRLSEAILLANQEIYYYTNEWDIHNRPQVSVLIAAIHHNTLNLAYVGNVVAHVWRNDVSLPISANHNRYSAAHHVRGINNRDRLGIYPEVDVRNVIVDQPRSANIQKDNNGSPVRAYSIFRPGTILILSTSEIQTQFIGDTIKRIGPFTDANALANELVTLSPAINKEDDVSSIVIRYTPTTNKRKKSNRLLALLFSSLFFVFVIGLAVFIRPKVTSSLRIAEPAIQPSALYLNPFENDRSIAVQFLDSSSLETSQRPGKGPANEPTGNMPENLPVSAKLGRIQESLPSTLSPQNPTVSPLLRKAQPKSKAILLTSQNDENDVAPLDLFDKEIVLVSTSTPVRLATSVWRATDTAAVQTPTPFQKVVLKPTTTPQSSQISNSTETNALVGTQIPVVAVKTPYTDDLASTVPAAESRIRVQLLRPLEGANTRSRQIFQWSYSGELSEQEKFEVIFWKDGQDPMLHGFGIAAPVRNSSVTVDFNTLIRQISIFQSNFSYRWGVILVSENPYERIQFLAGGREFLFLLIEPDSKLSTTHE